MANPFFISPDGLDSLFAALRGAGHRILAAVERDGRTEMQPVERVSDVSRGHLQTTLSAKDVVFPKVERLLRYTLTGGSVQLESAHPEPQPTVLFGLRPCEAGAFSPLDAVFNWDSRDVFFNTRMAATTVVGLACTQADEACFCTSLGGAPDNRAGSDLFLQETEGGWLAEVLTPKGEALQALAPQAFQPTGDRAPRPVVEVPQAFDGQSLQERIGARFDTDIWRDQSLRCVGCGACAYVCPTCLCFDIQEEADPKRGERLRCWDSCGLAHFTLHASGHNPREHQSQRWRQRIQHKFRTYPERYAMFGCVGCGKCSRACPVDMNLREHLVEVAKA